MKAVIALSGLAGFVLFGPPTIRQFTHHPAHDHVTIHVQEAVRAAEEARVHADVRVREAGRAAEEARVRAEVRVREAEGIGEQVEMRVAANLDQSRCRYEADRGFEVAVGSGVELELLAGSGSLEIVGVEGLNEVRATARACASHEEFLDDLQLTAEERGSVLVVETHYPRATGGWGWGRRYARLDLRVEVPRGMVGDIQDGSGEAFFENLGSLRVEDGSGEMAFHNIMGDLTVDDGSGEMEIDGVRGFVSLVDGSGEIRLQSVDGDVEIDDGSGEIEIRGVGGEVTLEDSSGEIDVEDVAMSVTVLRDSSGSISVDGVGGNFVVERDGSGSIRHRDVQGTVDIPRRGGQG